MANHKSIYLRDTSIAYIESLIGRGIVDNNSQAVQFALELTRNFVESIFDDEQLRDEAEKLVLRDKPGPKKKENKRNE